MTVTGTVLYVRATGAEGGESGSVDALEATFEVVVADGAIDAIKRLSTDPDSVDCVVAPATLPDLPLDLFAERLEDVAPETPLVIAGELPDSPEAAAAVAAAARYVPPGRESVLVDRIRRLQGERRLEAALRDHDRLRNALADLAVDLAAATDRSEIESAVYERLGAVEGYRHVWVGRREEDGGLAVSVPVAGRLDETELEALVGGGDPSFVDGAFETGRVGSTEGRVPVRGGAAAEAGVVEENGGGTVLSSAAIPFAYDGRVWGLALVSTGRTDAFDSSEREVLADIGAVVGHALWAVEPERMTPVGSESTEEAQVRSGSTEGIENLIHELRNPLGIAQSHLAIAREEDDPESLERVEATLARMADIVDRVAMGLGGAPSVEESPGDLGDDVTHAWQSIDAEGANLEVVESPTLLADHELLVRMLANLFQNAVEHGGEDVTVRVGRLDDGFFVEDDGPGIPESERETVFERGYSTAADGLGIGLAIVRDVANAHGWGVAVATGGEGGARFEVTGVELVEEDATV